MTDSELIAELREWQEIWLQDAADLLERLDALRPPTLSWEQMATIVRAVIDHASPHSPVNDDIRSFCQYLLTVQP